MIAHRLVLTLFVTSGLTMVAADAVAAQAAAEDGYHFTTIQNLAYLSTVTQQVSWESAGEKLQYTSSVSWKFVLLPVAVTPERAELAVTITRVAASHQGPGSTRRVDSLLPADQDGHEDALLGHLLELKGATLTVIVDPRSGVVSEVRGGDELVKRVNRRFPAAFPGDPPPLEGAAKAAFGSAALARQWSQLLALPSAEPQRVPLAQPLTGELERRWTGSAFTLALPMGTDHLDGELVKDPTPVTARLTELAGTGRVDIKQGVPQTAGGDLRFTLTLNALTQPVVQHHQLTWSLARVGSGAGEPAQAPAPVPEPAPAVPPPGK